MDFSLPDDILALRDMLRHFVETEMRPMEMKYFSQGALEPAERQRLKTIFDQMGLWGAAVPEQFGGFGLELVALCVIEEELGRTFLPVDLGDVLPVLYACKDGQVKEYLEPALAGERRAYLAAREPSGRPPQDWCAAAIVSGEGFVLNGHKCLSGLPHPRDFLVVFAQAQEGLTAFLVDVDRPGVHLENGEPPMLQLENCGVPGSALLGEVGAARRLGSADAPRLWIRAGARKVGTADRLLEMAGDYAQEWVSLGAPLSSRPAIRKTLVELQARVDSARWQVYHAAWLADEDLPVARPAALVRIETAGLLRLASDLVTMVYGGPGPLPSEQVRRMHQGKSPHDFLDLSLTYARAIAANGWTRNERVSHPAG